jgi:hypothetical protein
MMTSVVVESGTSSCNLVPGKFVSMGHLWALRALHGHMNFSIGEFFKILFIYLFIKILNFVAKEFQFLLRNVNMMTKI